MISSEESTENFSYSVSIFITQWIKATLESTLSIVNNSFKSSCPTQTTSEIRLQNMSGGYEKKLARLEDRVECLLREAPTTRFSRRMSSASHSRANLANLHWHSLSQALPAPSIAAMPCKRIRTAPSTCRPHRDRVIPPPACQGSRLSTLSLARVPALR